MVCAKIFGMRKLVAVFLMACTIPCVANAYVNRELAIVRVMDKASGKAYTLNIPVGQAIDFEKLTIGVRACKQTDPFDAEDFFAFLEISKTDEGKIFSNWMSRNEPGQRPLQNADYDVWLVKCENQE